MPKVGAIIDGVKFMEHPLERMAPNSSAVCDELNTRWPEFAKRKGYIKRTARYNDEYERYIQPRGILSEDVENVIKNTIYKEKTNKYGTKNKVYKGSEITVITDPEGTVITVWHNSENKIEGE